MERSIMRAWGAPFVLALFAACGGSEAADESQTSDLPGTEDASELWTYLSAADYTSWRLWPQKGERYPGGEPHGSTLTTYLNPAAAAALDDGAAAMPAGAIIVKENYMPSGELDAVTTMYKVDGYNSEAGDWHWVKFAPDGSVFGEGAAQGRVPGCIACHTGRADNDYIFTSDLGGGP